MLLKQSTARSLVVFMTDSADHITGKTGLTLTITASKDGAAFGSISPTVTELATGWYKLALTTSHTDTLGDLALHITSTGADPTDLVRQVVADLPGASVSSVTGAVGSVTGAVGSVTGAVGSVTGNVGGNVVGTVASVVGAVGSVTGNVGGNVVGSVASVTARVTANTDQLAGQTVTAAAGVTFPTSVASPTNITAGTITTVTNLTNAPTAGDFTATMKTSITTAATAATPTVAAVTGAVGSVTGNVGGNVTGSVGSVVGAVGSVTGNVGGNVSGSVSTVLGDVQGDIQGSLIGNVIGQVTSVAQLLSGSISSAAFLAGAIDANAIAADAVTEIQSGLSTLTAAGVRSAVGLASANLDTQLDGLPTAAENADAVWDEALSGHAVSGSTGEALSDAGAAGTPPSAAAIADAVWDEAIAGHVGAGSTGEALSDAGGAGTPPTVDEIWAKVIEAGYTAEDLLRLISAVQLGKTTIAQGSPSGAEVTYRDVNDTADRVVAEMSSNPAERLSVALTP